jgi:hypothetical protein
VPQADFDKGDCQPPLPHHPIGCRAIALFFWKQPRR